MVIYENFFPVFLIHKHKYLQNYATEFLLLVFWSEVHFDFI